MTLRLLALAALLVGTGLPATGQPLATEAPADTLAGRFTVFTGRGQPASLDAIVSALAPGDVLLLGEQHDDAVAHALQLRLLDAIADRHPVVLGLEMFGTEVQSILDVYLQGVLPERDFLARSRPWPNYSTDYRPMVEAARSRGLPVVGTNAPQRFVAFVVDQQSVDAADRLPGRSTFLPPHIAPPSDTLAARFTRLMRGMPTAHGHGPSIDAMLIGQNLRDATMAWSIARARTAHPDAIVVHVNGSFHSADRLGIPEHLAREAPDARLVVVTMQPAADGTDTPALSPDDFTILTASP